MCLLLVLGTIDLIFHAKSTTVARTNKGGADVPRNMCISGLAWNACGSDLPDMFPCNHCFCVSTYYSLMLCYITISKK